MGEIYKFTIEGDIPSMKNILRVTRYGKPYYANKEIKNYKDSFFLQLPQKLRYLCIEKDVWVYTHLVIKDRRPDPHNLQAVIFDSLEYCGVIRNDRQIKRWEGRTSYDKLNPRVEIEMGVLDE